MTGRLRGCHVVVTGAGCGIGRALARGVAREGAAVTCLDIDEAAVTQTVGSLSAGGARAVAVGCDVARRAEVESALHQAVDTLGSVDVLVASAGGAQGERSPFLGIHDEAWGAMLDRNLTTAFICGSVFGRHMVERGRGAMVFISSQASEVVAPGLAHYCAAKGGVRQLVRAMAVELAPHGVRVNAVAPGPTLTEANRHLLAGPEAAMVDAVPLGRPAQPDELVGAVVYLASDEASFTIGATITVDGGFTLR